MRQGVRAGRGEADLADGGGGPGGPGEPGAPRPRKHVTGQRFLVLVADNSATQVAVQVRARWACWVC